MESNNGKDFQATAQKYGYEIKEVDQVNILDENLPSIQRQRNLVQWLFNDGTRIDDIKRFSLTNGGYVVAQLTDIIPEGSINIDTINLEGSINLIGEDGQNKGIEWGNDQLNRRDLRSDLKPQDGLPEDTVLWAHLQSLSGGAWNGCVYDYELINKNTL